MACYVLGAVSAFIPSIKLISTLSYSWGHLGIQRFTCSPKVTQLGTSMSTDIKSKLFPNYQSISKTWPALVLVEDHVAAPIPWCRLEKKAPTVTMGPIPSIWFECKGSSLGGSTGIFGDKPSPKHKQGNWSSLFFGDKCSPKHSRETEAGLLRGRTSFVLLV